REGGPGAGEPGAALHRRRAGAGDPGRDRDAAPRGVREPPAGGPVLSSRVRVFLSGWRLGAVLIAVVSLVAVLGIRAQAELLQDLGATFQQVAQSLAGAFPKVEAQIVAVDGSEARIEGPSVALLRPGLELTAYRRGEVFRHPVTGQVLGHAERELGTLVVTAVDGEQATARVVVGSGGEAPKAGDLARITAGRRGVAVLPPTGVTSPYESADQTALLLVSRFSALLDKTGRFVTVEPRRVLDVAGLSGDAPVLA